MSEPRNSIVALTLEKLVCTIRELSVGRGLNNHDVVVDYAMGAHRELDEIQIGDIEDHEIVVAKMNSGRRKRDESFVVVINIWVTRPDLLDAIEDATAHQDRILDWFAEYPDMGLGLPAVRSLEQTSSLNMTMSQTGQGWQTHITLRPEVEARLV